MGLNANKAGNKNSNRVEQPIIEADVYPAYLVQLIDLGLQPQKPYQGKEKAPVQEIMLTYELTDCLMVDENGDEVEDKPRWVSETLPFYGLFADKAKSTKRYLAFDPNEDFGGEFAKAVGMGCNVTIVNNTVGDKTYSNIGNVAPISAKKAAQMAPIKNATKVFDLDEPDMDVFNALPEWLREKIKGNLNYQGSPLQACVEKAGGKPAAKEDKPPFKEDKPKRQAAPEPEDDDNPY
jgi:hypothetical protein